MSDDDRQQDETPAPNPLDLPLGGHALADYMLQQAILQQALEENERLRAEVERRARQKQGQPFSSPRFDTAGEAEAYLEQQRKEQARQAQAHEALQTLMEKLTLGTELLESILDEDPAAEQKPTPEEVIKKYYRRHAKNPKITLKQVCAEMGVNYASIRVAKVAYDKQRRRGHKD